MSYYGGLTVLTVDDFESFLSNIEVDRENYMKIKEYFSVPPKKLLAVSGLRRTGKSIMMMRGALDLIQEGKQIVYFLANTTTTQQNLFIAIDHAIRSGCSHLFIDEVTYVDGF